MSHLRLLRESLTQVLYDIGLGFNHAWAAEFVVCYRRQTPPSWYPTFYSIHLLSCRGVFSRSILIWDQRIQSRLQ